MITNGEKKLYEQRCSCNTIYNVEISEVFFYMFKNEARIKQTDPLV